MSDDSSKKTDFTSKRSTKKSTVRDPSVRVKSAKGRKGSSTRWLKRQLNDPYVREAQRLGLRSRAAFKLMDIDEKYHLIKSGMVIIDLGAAPGGWSEYAAKKGAKQVLALDLLPMDHIEGVTSIQMDFMDDDAIEKLVTMMEGSADIVLSDMAPNTTGHRATDHLRIMCLVEAAYEFAREILKPNGAFVAKVFQGGAQHELLSRIKQDFKVIRHVKPPSSRKDSTEQFLVATGFKGEASDED
jgi:23S rRNA (uridine2552-2'-O)-methyltransferase